MLHRCLVLQRKHVAASMPLALRICCRRLFESASGPTLVGTAPECTGQACQTASLWCSAPLLVTSGKECIRVQPTITSAPRLQLVRFHWCLLLQYRLLLATSLFLTPRWRSLGSSPRVLLLLHSRPDIYAIPSCFISFILLHRMHISAHVDSQLRLLFPPHAFIGTPSLAFPCCHALQYIANKCFLCVRCSICHHYLSFFNRRIGQGVAPRRSMLGDCATWEVGVMHPKGLAPSDNRVGTRFLGAIIMGLPSSYLVSTCSRVQPLGVLSRF